MHVFADMMYPPRFRCFLLVGVAWYPQHTQQAISWCYYLRKDKADVAKINVSIRAISLPNFKQFNRITIARFSENRALALALAIARSRWRLALARLAIARALWRLAIGDRVGARALALAIVRSTENGNA